MRLALGLSALEQLKDPTVAAELEQIVATLQQWGTNLGQWNPVTYATTLFSTDAGTWKPVAGDVRLFKWCVIGSRMSVQFHVQNGAATGTVKVLYLSVPNTGYKIVTAPNAAVPTLAGIGLVSTARCGIWQNTSVYKPGTVGIVNARTDLPVLACFLDDTSQINTVANAGCFGQIDFEVQPAA